MHSSHVPQSHSNLVSNPASEISNACTMDNGYCTSMLQHTQHTAIDPKEGMMSNAQSDGRDMDRA
jgi:hypothetical protein